MSGGPSRRVAVGAGAAVLVAALLVTVGVVTAPVRGAVRTYTGLIAAANAGDVALARRLYSARYLARRPPVPSAEGGIVGLPRGIHKNFRGWREGPNVWLCPTNRVGPVYQFVFEAGAWRFDGPVGLLTPSGEVVRYEEGETPSG